MKIYLMLNSYQSTDCQVLKAFFAGKNHELCFFGDFYELFDAISHDGPLSVELIVIDYYAFDHDYFNPYQELKKMGLKIPMVYYNDPYPSKNQLADYWLTKNRDMFKKILDLEGERELREVLALLQKVNIKSSRIFSDKYFVTPLKMEEENTPYDYSRKFIPPLELHYEKKHQHFDIEKFCIKHSIGQSRRKLLDFFHRNHKKTLDVETICLFMWNEFSEKKARQLYSYIYDLRKAFKAEGDYNLSLSRCGKNQYSFFCNPGTSL